MVAIVDNQSTSADFQIPSKGLIQFNNKAVQDTEVNKQITDQSVAISYFTLNPLVLHAFTDSKSKYSLSNQTTIIPKIDSYNQG